MVEFRAISNAELADGVTDIFRDLPGENINPTVEELIRTIALGFEGVIYALRALDPNSTSINVPED